MKVTVALTREELCDKLTRNLGIQVDEVLVDGMLISKSSDINTDTYRMELLAYGEHKIAAIKLVRQYSSLGLKEAKDLVEGVLPITFLKSCNEVEAQQIMREALGQGVTVRRVDNT